MQITKRKPGSVRRKIGNALSTVALVLAIVLCVFVIGQVLSQGYVSIGGYSLFRVATPSMEPTMQVGCLLIAKDMPISVIQEEDIVVFRSRALETKGSIVTHRVTQVLTDVNGEILLETKGDANQYPDGHKVDKDNLIGCVTYYTEDGNFFSELMRAITSPLGFFAMIVIPCLVIGVIVMRGTMANIRKEMDVLTEELKEQEKQEQERKQQEAAEYEQLCSRLRAELLEEMKQSADQEEKTE